MPGEILSLETTKRIEELEKENEKLKKQLNAKEILMEYLPNDTEFIIMTKRDYKRLEKENEKENKLANDK